MLYDCKAMRLHMAHGESALHGMQTLRSLNS